MSVDCEAVNIVYFGTFFAESIVYIMDLKIHLIKNPTVVI